MRNLITALGSNAATYEAIALKIVDLIDTAEISLRWVSLRLRLHS
jgi:hypothetical protein